ncbi:hypothetical protein BC938DRAFT_473848 [Jimgerdemannia flammicorona]|uniref:Uncharacterized protein n=1 Tax=Jimgerdemannia flammicorona TaxID=994334 RepID=A0A433QT12_9FUNG|nr:hypothetical protein BC938DRAFT_473848 [Jimgerdemannia flammicorona]
MLTSFISAKQLPHIATYFHFLHFLHKFIWKQQMTTAKGRSSRRDSDRQAALSFLSTISLGDRDNSKRSNTTLREPSSKSTIPENDNHHRNGKENANLNVDFNGPHPFTESPISTPRHSPKPPDSADDLSSSKEEDDASGTVTNFAAEKTVRAPRARRKISMRHGTAATSFLANISLDSSATLALGSARNRENRTSEDQPRRVSSKRLTGDSVTATPSQGHDREYGGAEMPRPKGILVDERPARDPKKAAMLRRENSGGPQEAYQTYDGDDRRINFEGGVGDGDRKAARKLKRSGTSTSLASSTAPPYSRTTSSSSSSFTPSASTGTHQARKGSNGSTIRTHQKGSSSLTGESGAPYQRPSAQGSAGQLRRVVYSHGSSPQELSEALKRRSVMFTTQGGTPLGIFSVRKYNDEMIRQQQEKRTRFNREYMYVWHKSFHSFVMVV